MNIVKKVSIIVPVLLVISLFVVYALSVGTAVEAKAMNTTKVAQQVNTGQAKHHWEKYTCIRKVATPIQNSDAVSTPNNNSNNSNNSNNVQQQNYCPYNANCPYDGNCPYDNCPRNYNQQTGDGSQYYGGGGQHHNNGNGQHHNGRHH